MSATKWDSINIYKHIIGFFSKIHTMKLKNQLLLSFMLLSIIPMLIVAALSYSISYNSILDKSILSTQEVINRATDEINQLIVMTETLSEHIQYEPNLQAAMRSEKNANSYDERISALEINTLMSLIQSYTTPGIFGIYCIGDNGRQYKSNTNSLPYENPQEFNWYQHIINAEKPIWYTPHSNSFIAKTPEGKFITFGAPFVDKLTGKRNGVLLVDIRASVVQDIIKNVGLLDCYIADNEDNVIFSSSDDQDNAQIQNLSNKIQYQKALSNNWKVVCIISKDKIASETLSGLAFLMVFVFAITVIISIVISIFISKQISTPVKTLMDLMQQIERGDFTVHVKSIDTCYEMKNLLKSFNSMIVKEKNFLAQIKHEHENLRKAQFSALQAQINPHFLYNSMDMIVWNIRMDEKDKAIAAVMALTQFFRCSLRGGADIISIKEELEQVALYLQIQQLRYGDKIVYNIQMDENLSDYSIPKLIIQPIVENAIYHGIKNKEGVGVIQIMVSEEAENIVIDATDNGIGITSEKVTLLNLFVQKQIADVTKGDKNSYGIKNVNERIQIYFGERYGLFFASEYGEFTTVSLVFPKTPIEQHCDEIHHFEVSR